MGGLFTAIGGQTRNEIACLDTGTALANAWDPNADGAVNVLAINGTNLYVGGNFTTIGGAARPYFAQFGPESARAINTRQEISSRSYRITADNFSGNRGTIRYFLPYDSRVSLRIYDMKGRLFSSIMNQFQGAGNHTIPVSNERLSTGLYLLRFSAGGYEKTMGITIMR